MTVLCWILKAIVAIFFIHLGIPCIFAFVLGLIALIVCSVLDMAESRKIKLLEDNHFTVGWEKNKPTVKKWKNGTIGKEIYEYQLSMLKRRELLQWIKDGKLEN